ncbi:MAG: hypothetical protein A2W00_14525 [Candidatus Eisenbacteria bacterium RBG_16_71_46]|nr:MAG: hypothetical protein A2W00_14525 [Candidatus Eisenbacteria bacterium RBG_16_71_46]
MLFNLYLVAGGFQEAFVGRAISFNGLGLALTALPAGWLANHWGRRRCLILGAALEGTGLLARSLLLHPGAIYGASFLAGAGQSLIAIAAAPFLTEHSTPRERTHLFSALFAVSLLAGVAGSLIGGALPAPLMHLPAGLRLDAVHAYRVVLVLGALFAFAAGLPLLALRGLPDAPLATPRGGAPPAETRRLAPIALNAFLIGAGAGLVIPFMNLYFAHRFACSSIQIGVFFSVAQVFTAVAALLGPALARRFGRLRTATASELLSLPFLVTLGAERRLSVAVGAFWVRATLMQAATPLVQSFIMEALPPALRARSTSLNNMMWNVGWAASATLAGAILQRFGYAVPFYITAALYFTAAVSFYAAFRREAAAERAPVDLPPAVRLSEEAKGLRGEGPSTE